MTITNRNLQPGTRLEAKYRGQSHEARVCQDGVIELIAPRPAGAQQYFKSLSKAANAITGNSVNGWRFWSIAGSTNPAVRQAVADGEAAADEDEMREAQAALEAEGHPIAGLEPKMVKVIKRTANQRGIPASQVRYFCSACMAGFLFPEGPAPEACPEGHAATRPA
jgi:rubrerythrin